MKLAVCFTDDSREAFGLRVWCFGCTLLTFFAVILTVGVLTVAVLSASACIWNLHVRCFSIRRDTLGVISSAAEMWAMLALAVALFAATFAQMYRGLAWWSGVIVAPLSVLAVGMLPVKAASLAKEATSETLFFLAVSLVLFVAYQLSLFIIKLIGK